jgi:GNAT superfamily N-acetyltransferase
MDLAVEWLVRQGITKQWGTQQPSEIPDRIKQFTSFAESGGLWVAVDSQFSGAENSNAAKDVSGVNGSSSRPGDVVGAIAVGDATPYVKPAEEPELYIKGFLTDRSWAGRGIGAMLLAKARQLARDAGVSVLRVDCYRGDDGKLVKYYESQGFVKMEEFQVHDWPGQVLMQRLG